ncbi:hypothetical protein [Streptomyces sp. NBC_01361]|uniref:hypothetical protein n=1 Tax=Streptomyces sp. NBC_01361 TaxID=2903838 RepID=UPI002E382396|nr:hypothetical protein [Streptomyces sp. NBC_01361]
MSATTTSGPAATGTTNLSPVMLQAIVTTWAITGMVLFGAAWALGLQADWWQRILLALPVAGLAYLDARGFAAVIEIRAGLTRALADLNWVQIPLAVAGGAWLLGLMADSWQRLAVGVIVGLVAALFHYAPHAAAPAGGTR